MLVGELFLNRDVEGEVGIEIEYEGRCIDENIKGWSHHDDGSLNNGHELVLSNPAKRDEYLQKILTLKKGLKSQKITPRFSYRTSVHVHINVRDMTLFQCVNLILLSWIYEDSMVEFSGQDRVGNLYCLSRREIQLVEGNVFNALSRKDFNRLPVPDGKYAGINLTSLRTFGSIEYRMMRGTLDSILLKRWIDFLLCLKDASMEYKDPEELFQELSTNGILAFTRKHIEPFSRKAVLNKGWSVKAKDSLREISYIFKGFNWKDFRWRNEPRRRPREVNFAVLDDDPNVPRPTEVNFTWDHINRDVEEVIGRWNEENRADVLIPPNPRRGPVELRFVVADNPDDDVKDYNHNLLRFFMVEYPYIQTTAFGLARQKFNEANILNDRDRNSLLRKAERNFDRNSHQFLRNILGIEGYNDNILNSFHRKSRSSLRNLINRVRKVEILKALDLYILQYQRDNEPEQEQV